MVETSQQEGWWPQTMGRLKDVGERIAHAFAPQSEASIDGDVYDIKIELPGVALDDIHVECHDHSIVVSGEKRAEIERSTRSYYFSERVYGAFRRVFRLPPDADVDHINADYQNGVLTLRVGKQSKDSSSGRRIEVKGG